MDFFFIPANHRTGFVRCVVAAFLVGIASIAHGGCGGELNPLGDLSADEVAAIQASVDHGPKTLTIYVVGAAARGERQPPGDRIDYLVSPRDRLFARPSLALPGAHSLLSQPDRVDLAKGPAILFRPQQAPVFLPKREPLGAAETAELMAYFQGLGAEERDLRSFLSMAASDPLFTVAEFVAMQTYKYRPHLVNYEGRAAGKDLAKFDRWVRSAMAKLPVYRRTAVHYSDRDPLTGVANRGSFSLGRLLSASAYDQDVEERGGDQNPKRGCAFQTFIQSKTGRDFQAYNLGESEVLFSDTATYAEVSRETNGAVTTIRLVETTP